MKTFLKIMMIAILVICGQSVNVKAQHAETKTAWNGDQYLALEASGVALLDKNPGTGENEVNFGGMGRLNLYTHRHNIFIEAGAQRSELAAFAGYGYDFVQTEFGNHTDAGLALGAEVAFGVTPQYAGYRIDEEITLEGHSTPTRYKDAFATTVSRMGAKAALNLKLEFSSRVGMKIFAGVQYNFSEGERMEPDGELKINGQPLPNTVHPMNLETCKVKPFAGVTLSIRIL